MRNGLRSAAGLSLAGILIAATGCPPAAQPERASREQVFGRLNANSRGMDFLVIGLGDAVAEIPTEPAGASPAGSPGAPPREPVKLTTYTVEVKMLHRRPKRLYVRLEHTFSGQIEIGSNDDEFWLWDQCSG